MRLCQYNHARMIELSLRIASETVILQESRLGGLGLVSPKEGQSCKAGLPFCSDAGHMNICTSP